MSHGAKFHKNPNFFVINCFHDLENVSVKSSYPMHRDLLPAGVSARSKICCVVKTQDGDIVLVLPPSSSYHFYGFILKLD